MNTSKGDFTLPGEAGYEKLTLELAKKWGADVIRDSDGTVLSDEIVNAGYEIYSTICIIREHNEWLSKHPDQYQQTFLQSRQVMATADVLSIHLLDGYFEEQFKVNTSEESVNFWQVFDRTSNTCISRDKWVFDRESGNVIIQGAILYHNYTVNFFAFRIWEEISMYNHVTNSWNKEHLGPVDPRSEIAQEYLLHWLDNWCKDHPNTDVVRFTSMFYNFVWIWGSNSKQRNIFSDWGSYDFSVSPKALQDFEKEYGYALTSEDFINHGKFHVTHMVPTDKQRDYMEFTQRFVSSFGRKLVDLVHEYGKKAYVFFDDSWIGVEPYGKYFKDFNFDGLIKCVFSGFEVRLCAGADAKVHELRLHPYLFPVGLGGVPTFSEGGNPTLDAKNYWISVRRALLRQCVDRLGLGGYLHLTENYPDFNDYIEELLGEFRLIKSLHKNDEIYTIPIKVAVLHSWGKLRSWTLSGHFHETFMHVLIHINEALSGLPVNVEFIDFKELVNKDLNEYNVIINAGRSGSAWSGGANWENADIVAKLNEWVFKGGTFIGVGEPSACKGYNTTFAMAEVLGVDEDLGDRVCHGKLPVSIDEVTAKAILPSDLSVKLNKDIYLVSENAVVLAGEDNAPSFVINPFGKGYGVYLADFEKSNSSARMLLNLLMYCTGNTNNKDYIAENHDVDCAFFVKSNTLLAVNNSGKKIETKVFVPGGFENVVIKPYELKKISLKERQD